MVKGKHLPSRVCLLVLLTTKVITVTIMMATRIAPTSAPTAPPAIVPMLAVAIAAEEATSIINNISYKVLRKLQSVIGGESSSSINYLRCKPLEISILYIVG